MSDPLSAGSADGVRRRARARATGAFLAGVVLAGFGAIVLGMIRTAPGLAPLGITFATLGLCALLVGGFAVSVRRRFPDVLPLSGVLILLRFVIYAVAVGGGLAALTAGLPLIAAIGTALLGVLAAVVVDLMAAGVLRDIRAPR
ncbi:hypothetical protein [Microbacterium sp. 22242]|uniref:hypothetical protein n=1 Tax=Microbacterium sp. 22242 TaxID=3453896 RepID=UPI003F8732D7